MLLVWSTPLTLQTSADAEAVLLVFARKLAEPFAQTGKSLVLVMVMFGNEVERGDAPHPTDTELRFTTSKPADISLGNRFFFATPLVTVDAITSVAELCSVWVI